MLNGVMLQYFEWELPNDCQLWRKAGRDALQLRHMGFTAVWLPPAYKGSAGINDVGYGVYDTYDLGEPNTWRPSACCTWRTCRCCPISCSTIAWARMNPNR